MEAGLKLSIKLFLKYLLTFILILAGDILLIRMITPEEDYIRWLNSFGYKYLLHAPNNTKGDAPFVIIPKDSYRIHKNLHKTLEEIYDCENNMNFDCYASADCLILSDNLYDKYRPKTLTNSQTKHILVSDFTLSFLGEPMPKEVLLKNSTDFQKYEIEGVIFGFYGFPDFSSINKNTIFLSKTDCLPFSRGDYYELSNEKRDSLDIYSIDSLTKARKKLIATYKILHCILIFMFSVINIMLFNLMIGLRKHTQRLQILGIKRVKINIKVLKACAFDFSAQLILDLILRLLLKKKYFLSIDFIIILVIFLFSYLIFARRNNGNPV